MVCGKCRHEFCWMCLGPFPGYSHTTKSHCPARGFCVYGVLMLIFLLLNQKLYYASEWYYWVVSGFFYNLAASLLIDFIVISFGSYVVIYQNLHRYSSYRNSYSPSFYRCGICVNYFALAIMLCLHITYFYLALFTDTWPFLWRMLVCLAYESIIAIFVGILVLIFYAVKAISRIFSFR